MNNWKDENVFVTGATGLLGSWLVEELVNRGAVVTCLIRDQISKNRLDISGYVKKVNVVRGEVEDLPLLQRVLNEYEIGSVFHLAAQTIVGVANRSPVSTFNSNIAGTWNVLEACRLNAKLVRRVVIASSDKAYGTHDILPYREDASLIGKYPYDVSKSCADLISFSYWHSFKVPVSVTRCGNLFGGGDLNFNRLVPGTVKSFFHNENPLIRSDGTLVRDYFYVKDAVDAYLSLAEAMNSGREIGEAYNFGTESPLSVIELVTLIGKLMDKEELAPRILNQATCEIPRQYLDCSKAKKKLGWSPSYGMEKGLRQTIDWYIKWFGN